MILSVCGYNPCTKRCTKGHTHLPEHYGIKDLGTSFVANQSVMPIRGKTPQRQSLFRPLLTFPLVSYEFSTLSTSSNQH